MSDKKDKNPAYKRIKSGVCSVKDLKNILDDFEDDNLVEIGTSGGAGTLWIKQYNVMEEF